MGAFGALFGCGVLAAAFSVAGVQLFPGFVAAIERVHTSTQLLVLWIAAALCAAAAVAALTRWPVAAVWAFCATLAVPLLRSNRNHDADSEIEKVEAIATWSEQIRDTMAASAGLQQALVVTARAAPAAIESELLTFARSAPRGDLAGSLRRLGQALSHPCSDMVIAGLVSATDLDAGRLVPLLTRLASSIRDEAQMRVRVEVGRARVRMSMRIVGGCVSLTALLVAVAGQDLLVAYNSVTGQLWLLVVGSVVVAAIWSSRRLARMPQPERFVARAI